MVHGTLGGEQQSAASGRKTCLAGRSRLMMPQKIMIGLIR
jgi:hypothetical protein